MTARPASIRVWTAVAIVAALALAYFAGGVRVPDRVSAAPATSPIPTPTPTGAPGGPAVPDNTVSVGGLGRVSGTPDTLLLQMGVETHGADVSAALAGANAAISKVSAALKANGVAAADIRTSGIGVNANYNYDNGKQTLVDYVASESLTVKLRDLAKAGTAISAAVTAGGNDARVHGASLDLEGNTTLVRDARAAAFADAKAKAEQYAKLAGRELGAVTAVSEQVQGSPPVPMAQAAAGVADAARSSVPVERGSQEVAVHVQVVWSLR